MISLLLAVARRYVTAGSTSGSGKQEASRLRPAPLISRIHAMCRPGAR
ncbi:hypothetical protein ACH4ZX_07180 [Streptomyces sp. NPDC020490]